MKMPRLFRRSPKKTAGFVGGKQLTRMFSAARPGRTTDGWITATSSADSESIAVARRIR